MFNANDYFKQLAIQHVELQHTEEEPAFFREYSSAKILLHYSDFLDNMRYNKRNVLISQFNYESNIGGQNSDSKIDIPTGSIYVIRKKQHEEGNETGDEVLKATRQIIEDIVLRLQHDSEQGNFPVSIDMNNIRIVSMGEIADGYWGHTAFIQWLESFECKGYDETKWNIP